MDLLQSYKLTNCPTDMLSSNTIKKKDINIFSEKEKLSKTVKQKTSLSWLCGKGINNSKNVTPQALSDSI